MDKSSLKRLCFRLFIVVLVSLVPSIGSWENVQIALLRNPKGLASVKRYVLGTRCVKARRYNILFLYYLFIAWLVAGMPRFEHNLAVEVH